MLTIAYILLLITYIVQAPTYISLLYLCLLKYIAIFIMKLLFCLAVISVNTTAAAQPTNTTYTLPQLEQLAMQNSTEQKLASTTLALAQLGYEQYRLQRKPTIILNGNAPVYDKDNFSVRQPDGSIRFLNRSQVNSNFNLGILQTIVATGGTLSVNTNLNRFDELIGKTKQYNGTPIYIQLQQPLFAYNTLKWQKKTEPLKLQNAQLAAKQSTYNLALTIAEYYLSIVALQYNIERTTTAYNLHLLSLAAEKKRKELGIGDTDKLLQLQITSVSYEQQLIEQRVEKQTAILKLEQFLQVPIINSTMALPTTLRLGDVAV